MKKTRLLLLVLLAFLASPLVGGDLKVGAGIRDVTPQLGVPLDGAISQNGPVEAIHDPLHVRALVFDDGATRVALAVVDNTMLSASLIDDAKTLIENEAGIPGSHVIIAATHSHSTPRGLVGLVDDPLFEEYLGSLPVASRMPSPAPPPTSGPPGSAGAASTFPTTCTTAAGSSRNPPESPIPSAKTAKRSA